MKRFNAKEKQTKAFRQRLPEEVVKNIANTRLPHSLAGPTKIFGYV